jgi:hypothetical protein
MKSIHRAETDLYPPVRDFLEGQGYIVRGEVGPCDVLGVRNELTVAVELKLTLNLKLVFQGLDRIAAADAVYLAVPGDCPVWRRDRRRVVRLLRMLGLGLLLVDTIHGLVEPALDPGEYRPRPSPSARGRLLKEHMALAADDNRGGSRRKGGVMTLYRRKAILAAGYLEAHGPSCPAAVSRELGIPDARAILYRNVYGWFERLGRGVYALSPRGVREIPRWK